MKVCIIQPAYSTDYSLCNNCFDAEMELLSQCDSSMDLIVLPEYCDIPCLAKTKEEADAASAKYLGRLLDHVASTAKRCHAMVFVCARSTGANGQRNTTYAFDREGNVVGTITSSI